MDKPPKVPGERQAPLCFAGRRDELAALDEKLRDLCATGDPTNGLQLTVGVPGAGKTQLAGEFAKRIAGEIVHGRAVAVLNLPPEREVHIPHRSANRSGAVERRRHPRRLRHHALDARSQRRA